MFSPGIAIIYLSFYPHPPRFHVLAPRLTRAVRHYEFGVWIELPRPAGHGLKKNNTYNLDP